MPDARDVAMELRKQASLILKVNDLLAEAGDAVVIAPSRDSISFLFVYKDERNVELARRLRKAIGGLWEKSGDNNYFRLTRKPHGKHPGVVITTLREQTCTAKVVGYETVKVADYSQVPTKSVEKPILEWDCSALFQEA